jgi:hypothetical protein
VAELTIGLTGYAAEDPGSWQWIGDRAVAADIAGVDRVIVSDHVVYGEHLEEYARPEVGGQAGGRQPTGSDGHWLEPLTTLTYVAALTSRVRLRTNIILAALRTWGGSEKSTKPQVSTSMTADISSTERWNCVSCSGASRGRASMATVTTSKTST